ncbi:MAG: hypothetical protein H6712_20030 [Myxococcales bacterium]|nr:hypothetical protein [Myxococcales bacterium]MCB9716166.1 hypothetical protein [Myxococcales bacterium]
MPFLLRSSSWLAVAASLLAGCSVSADAPRPAAQQAQPEPASAEAPVAVAEPAKAEPLRTTKPSDTPAGPLTEEELALIAADPADLTVEQRRQRAYARRKQIMQNPDSPTARALKDLAEAHQNGEIDVGPKGKDGVWFSVPGTKPTGGRPPAGWRPPEDDGAEGEPSSETPAPAEGADAP